MWVEHVLTAQNKMAIWTRAILRERGTYILDTRYVCVRLTKLPSVCCSCTTRHLYRQPVSLQQTCQLSRIWRETHAFRLYLTLTRIGLLFSRIFILHPDFSATPSMRMWILSSLPGKHLL